MVENVLPSQQGLCFMKIVINKIISIMHRDIRFQDPNQSNVDNLNNVRCEASRSFRNKKRNI